MMYKLSMSEKKLNILNKIKKKNHFCTQRLMKIVDFFKNPLVFATIEFFLFFILFYYYFFFYNLVVIFVLKKILNEKLLY